MNFRIGIGTDLHRLDSDSTKPLVIGGIQVSSAKGVIAHSDGDVLIHAIVDSLLGACALGDIGEIYPDSNPEFKDKKSEFFLLETVKKLKQQNYTVANIDCVIHLQEPKLKPYKAGIKENIARMLEIGENCVNIKAKTREKLDAVGAGNAIEAIVSVLVMQS